MGRKVHSSQNSTQGERSRRDFLKSATTVAAGLVAPKALEAHTAELLPTVMLGPHRVSRLIVGANPIYGYSHFNRQYDQHMLEWYTDERVVKLMLDCEKAGINTWQYSFNYNQKRQIPKIRAAGCKIQFICLVASWHYDEKMGRAPEQVLEGTSKCAQAAAEFNPLACVFHGGATDILFRAGKIDLVQTYVDRVHDMGMLAGISTHNPKILETLHEKGFANDFYMTGLHYVTRRPEEWMKEIGAHPLDEGWIDSDPPKMAAAIRKVNKPALVYKVLAAGRKCASEEQKRQAIGWAYKNGSVAQFVGNLPR